VTAVTSHQQSTGILEARIHRPATVDEAVRTLHEHPHAQYVAGATWLMRSPLRHESVAGDLILLSGIAGLRDIEPGDPVTFGSMVTLERAARAVTGMADLTALHEACRAAATPALRRMITLGGSVSATAFHASDIVPALLCLDAEVVADRGLVTRIRLPRSSRVSCHERLTWRSGGEYSIATVSISMDRTTQDCRVAVGSVESAPRRWASVERELSGRDFTPREAADVVRDHLSELSPVPAPGIPAAYRLDVLPTVMERAVGRLP
jgi:carbon-monoxide dehydrogenase medium subunit